MNISDIIDSNVNSSTVNTNRIIFNINDNNESITANIAKITKKSTKNMIKVCII